MRASASAKSELGVPLPVCVRAGPHGDAASRSDGPPVSTLGGHGTPAARPSEQVRQPPPSSPPGYCPAKVLDRHLVVIVAPLLVLVALNA